MRAVVQRVNSASVSVDNETVAEIGNGVLVYIGVFADDEIRDAEFLADKVMNLRIFPDENDINNLSLLDIDGSVLAVSQFTICADARHGRRPNYSNAAKPDLAKSLYDEFCRICAGKVKTRTGIFQAHMHIQSLNDGPITILLDSRRLF